MNTTNRATAKLVREIAAHFKDFDRRPPAEQMATYFAVGLDLGPVVMDQVTYGPRGIADIASRVSHLGTEERASWVMSLGHIDEEDRAFILEEAATPMDNGQPLTLGHWRWVFRACSPERPAGNEEQFRRELAWLRRESPSEEVLEHIEEVLDREHEREQDELREQVREAASHLLGAL
ncbi:hypothetical protein [Urbifossiella limnaea]|uniref:Uncharacterized protein n=1 Tax=Urbifossiella limnaea TaxID=2528023 RepID=A0A517XW72_9BACT|nr:hypothetical protein [Urbifossiella limnaea]QDU21737.1 hypothetical protein ETAA1_37100 [Urbifossiella limnaea]